MNGTEERALPIGPAGIAKHSQALETIKMAKPKRGFSSRTSSVVGVIEGKRDGFLPIRLARIAPLGTGFEGYLSG